MKSQLSLEALVAFAAFLAVVCLLVQAIHLLQQRTEAQGADLRLQSQKQSACWNAQSFVQKFTYARMNASLQTTALCKAAGQKRAWG